ncbi:hypothetical protein DMUE_3448 [Dictyocoela muelleri]|nr:hypothetical protein DMUE_3448 [Dictyocoela muelleri]
MKKVDMLCVVNWVERSLNEITDLVIINCWDKTKIFSIEKTSEIQIHDHPDEDSSSSTSIVSINDVVTLKYSMFKIPVLPMFYPFSETQLQFYNLMIMFMSKKFYIYMTSL